MLRQVIVIKKDDIIYERLYANALKRGEIEDLRFKIKKDAIKEKENAVGFFDYYKYRVSYVVDLELDIIYIFITGLMDDYFSLIKPEMDGFKNEFLEIFEADLSKNTLDPEKIKILNKYIDSMHKNIKPKIAVVGYSGVGKTTTKNLIRMDEIPSHHIPTISGDVATAKIGDLEFQIFDFAGQEQFSYLWKGFIKGSNAVLVVTDSSPLNVEKSRFFIDLRNDEAPYARIAILGNKQDLDNAMDIDNIENILGIKTYPMVANQPENREKMIQIIANILDMNIESSPLIEGLIEGNKFASEPMKEAIKEISLDERQEYLRQINIDQKLSNEVSDDIKGVKVENILRNHLKMINYTVKSLNNGQELTFEEFYNYYQGYTKNALGCRNIALKQFLETQFSRLRKEIEEDEFIATKLKEDVDAIINALLCAYLTKSNPQKYPIFENILNDFTFKGFDSQTIKDIHAYYLRVINKFGV
ncbi:MAG: ADP-ribosylation factor-like protein [Promethearchaeota archaeon]